MIRPETGEANELQHSKGVIPGEAIRAGLEVLYNFQSPGFEAELVEAIYRAMADALTAHPQCPDTPRYDKGEVGGITNRPCLGET
jgi:hypothetical protein